MAIRITAGYAALMVVLGAGVLGLPGLAAVLWAVIGLLSICAVVLGVRMYRPVRAAPWWFMAAALGAMAAGDTVFGAAVHRRQDPSPMIADVCYLAMFPLIAAGLIQMTRTSVVLRDRSRLVDLLIFSCAAGLLGCVFLIGPGLGAPTMDRGDVSMQAAYVLGDLLALVACVRLLVGARGSWAVLLVAVGVGGMLVSDVSYALAELDGGWQPGGPAELGYLVFYAASGAAALRPGMAELTVPVDARSTELRVRWMVLIGLSLAVPPAVLVYESMTGGVRDGVMIAVAAALMSVLVITRLADAITKYRRSIARERVLRGTCGTLLTATEPAQVGAAVRVGVSALMPPGVEHRVVLLDTDPGDAVAAGAAAEGPIRLVPTRILHPSVRGQLRPLESALVCPLGVRRGGAEEGWSGVLFVAADDRLLHAMRDAVGVLVAQATLALERIVLTEAATRRDSDQYLRAVVQNTNDVVLVIDSDERIRCASPSLSTVLGVELPAFATLRDILEPDDHAQVTRTLEREWQAEDPDGIRDTWNLRRPDHSRVLVEVSYRDLRADRMVRGFVLTIRDVTERRRHEQERIQRALHGSSAGLNRLSARNKFT